MPDVRTAVAIAVRGPFGSWPGMARPGPARESIRQGAALFALAALVGLTVGLVLITASRSSALSPMLERGGAPPWLAWPWHTIAPAVRVHLWRLDGLFTLLVTGIGVCYLTVLAFARSLPAGP